MYDHKNDELKRIDPDDQESIERAIPDPKDRGPVFQVGEIVELKGIKFKIRTMGSRMLVLLTMPQPSAVVGKHGKGE